MTVTKEMIEAARKAAPVHLGPALDSTIVRIGEAMLGAHPAVAVPDGWKLVPVEPTVDMMGAYHNAKRTMHTVPEIWRAILAAAPQPAPRPVAVKPLEWDSVIDGGRDRVAKTVIGEYVVSVDHPNAGGTHYLWVSGQPDSDEHHSEYRTMDAAKAAAQADYERRILSALTTPPADQKENERLRQRVKALEDENERLKELADKYKWQVRDTCVRAEKTESKMQSIANQIQENKPSPASTDEYASGYADGRYDAWLLVQEAADNATATTAHATAAEQRVKALEEAANNVISGASDSYRKRNGQIATLEDDSGEKSWIVSYDAFEDLRAALKGCE